jgi:hypothetical protein
METEGNINSVTTNSEQKIRNLTVIQDFNNKKANSHATLFVASMFALFTVLSLASRIVTPASFSFSNYLILSFSLINYIFIWIFGLYSMLNFSYYSTVSQRAEEEIVCGLDNQLISDHMKEWKGILKCFANYKMPNLDKKKAKKIIQPEIEGQEIVSKTIVSRNLEIFIIGYAVIGLLPFLAFLIWFCGC